MHIEAMVKKLEFEGICMTTVEDLWERVGELHVKNGHIPAPPLGNTIVNLRSRLRDVVKQGPKHAAEARQLGGQLSELLARDRELRAAKKQINKDESDARIKAASATRELIQVVIKECGKKMNRFACENRELCRDMPELLPE